MVRSISTLGPAVDGCWRIGPNQSIRDTALFLAALADQNKNQVKAHNHPSSIKTP